MAVKVRLGANGVPGRMAPACFPVTQTPGRAFGAWDHRVTAVYGTNPVPAPGPDTVANYPVPPGPTPGHTAAVPALWPTWSIVRPSLPRVLPWAGQVPHGVPGFSYTAAVGIPNQDQTIAPAIRPRGPIAQARVTTNPKPRFNWKRQGGGTTSN